MSALEIFHSCVSADERLKKVRQFDLQQCRHALDLTDVQPTVLKALRSRLRRLTKEATALTIKFEFHGQDFDIWALDKNGNVIDCAPMQEWLWSGCRVTNMRKLQIGSIVEFTRNGKASTIKYPVAGLRQKGKVRACN